MIHNISISKEAWRTKYRYDGETQLETQIRVARSLADVERIYNPNMTDEEVEFYFEKFLFTLVNFELLDTVPADIQEDVFLSKISGLAYKAIGLKCTGGGRITANIGTAFYGATLLNCFINYGIKGAKIEYTRRTPCGTVEIPVKIEGSEETADNLVNIMVSLMEQTITLASEGGYGINFDFIRPRGSLIGGSGVRHPGVIAYMEAWDKLAEIIVRGDQDGYQDTILNHLTEEELEALKGNVEKAMARKGAMMGVLSIWHPDIEEFVRAKQTKGRLTKFNISPLIDDKFMLTVINDEMYELHFEGTVYKRVKARDLWELIMQSSYNRNEPGVLFEGNMNKINPLLYLGRDNASNPCGEISGNPYLTTVCLLGSVNLTQYVRTDRTFDFEQYKADVETFARMLENVNDLGNVPLPQYQWALKNVRQYGMGINGLGSALMMMGIRYGSPESVKFVAEVNRIKEDLTWRSSALLAKERGPAGAFRPDFYETPFFKNHCKASDETKQLLLKYGARNLKTTTNPPLGNSSVVCNYVSNGIEPLFFYEYERTYIVDKWPTGLNQDNIKTILSEITAGDATAWKGEYQGKLYYYEPHNRGLCVIEPVMDYGYAWVKEHYPEDIESGASHITSAQELSVQDHLDVQLEVQKYLNQSVSKTVNLPHEYPYEDFKDLYMKAWKGGLVGFTTYRSGTMEAVLALSDESDKAPKGNKFDNFLEALKDANCIQEDAEITEDGVIVNGVKVPEVFDNGSTTIVKREGNKYYMHFSYLQNCDKHPLALWIYTNGMQDGEYVAMNRGVKKLQRLLETKGVRADLVNTQAEKLKGCPHCEKLGKMVSMCLRHNISVVDIITELEGIEDDYISSTLTAVRKFLSNLIPDGTRKTGSVCSSCGSDQVIFEGGCDKCLDCGYSGCG